MLSYVVKLVNVIIKYKFIIVTVTSTRTIDHQFIYQHYSDSKILQSSPLFIALYIVLQKIFRSIALMVQPVGVTTNCEKLQYYST